MSKVKNIIDNLERIGTIGSPSTTTELTLDILAKAVNKKLVGELALFDFTQDGKEHVALGQITDIELRNSWLEDPTMRSLARQRGKVNPVSGQQDVHLGDMSVSAVFAEEGESYEPSILGTVPETGTFIKLANDDVMNTLLEKHQSEIFYLGNVYGSTPKLPMWFKHFDSSKNFQGGAGEAYHLGIFGKTGSGKSVLAKMALTAYARYQQMAVLVIDPQGEFAKDFQGEESLSEFKLDLKGIFQKQGKQSVVISVKNLVLDTWELFENILFESYFFEKLTVPKGENRELACSVLSEKIKKKINLADLYLEESFEAAWKILSDESNQRVFYRSESSRDRFKLALADANKKDFYNDYWKPATELFRENRKDAKTIEKALGWLLAPNKGARPALIINLAKENAEGILWNEKIQNLVIKRVLQKLVTVADYSFRGNKNLNTLVVIDEAHRLAPRIEKDDESGKDGITRTLVDAARTTRKYGLGWMFISQTLNSIHKEIIGQLRISFFGFGLAMGSELQALKDFAGGEQKALKLYQSFRDPHSAFNESSRQYSFMTVGPISPLSFSGTPLFFTSFNTAEQFLKANKL